jgi:hypothetical protein
MRSQSQGLTQTTRVIAAMLLLNTVLSFSNWWPTPGVVPDYRVAPEFVWLWLILLATIHLRGSMTARMPSLLTLGYLLLVFGRYLDVTAPALFGREINLYWDGAQIPRFLWVWAIDAPWWQSTAAVFIMVALLRLLFLALRWGIDLLAREAVPYALTRRWVLWVTAILTALISANYAGVRATWPLVAKPVMPTYWRQAQLLASAFSPQRLNDVLPPSTTLQAALAQPKGAALAALQGRDVYLIVLESYGAVVYDHPQAVANLGAARVRFAADLSTGGKQVVSAFLRAPTFGGASDLSHLSLLSGIDLSDPMRHDLLLTTKRPTLTTLFRQHGYESTGFYPSLFWEWAEGEFYGYDKLLDGPMLGYPGPALGPWSIPDQYALARFEQKYPRSAEAPPRFVFFPTITSHFPFSPVPPYQPDWQRLLSEQPYDVADTQRALAEKIDWLNMLPDYLRMIDYTYRWLGGYLRQTEAREAVYILVGDHQPTANVSGEGASWDVPVHIVSSDDTLLRRFIDQGFEAGLDPAREPLGGLHDLTAMLLRAFAKPSR